MDELDVLKKQWQSRDQELPKLTFEEIYNMILKKSSSIVKWIFIISILELLFWVGLIFILPESYMDVTEELGMGKLIFYSNIVHFIIFITFIVLFYKNYKTIQVTESTAMLMTSILRTRKTVRYFVYYNIGMFIVSSIVMNIIYYMNSDKLYELMNFASSGIPKENFALFFIISQVVVGIIFVAVLMLFYWLVYGLLLRRLKSNYKELKKMED
jgi:hypothetical protein